jgi:4'-phosphopantetheinyl transferase EntD
MLGSTDLTSDSAWLATALPGLFPPPCATAWLVPTLGFAPLPASEAAAIVNAVDRRRAEFAAGRNSARQALARLGVPEAVIPAGSDRAPAWPAGTVGSIAHAEGMALAVVGRAESILSVGVDIELTGRVHAELWPHILTPPETREAERRPPGERAPWATAVFAIKEAFYKFQYPLTRRWLNFSDVEVTTVDCPGTFSVRTTLPLKVGTEDLTQFAGRYVVGPKFTLAGIYRRLV